MVDRQVVLEQLKKVLDPELRVNIVDLGLIYDVKVDGKKVSILMTLTFPGCPLGSIIHQEIQNKVGAIPLIEKVNVKITWNPPWDLSKISPQARAELGIV